VLLHTLNDGFQTAQNQQPRDSIRAIESNDGKIDPTKLIPKPMCYNVSVSQYQ
jgi:hypothetical protein